MSRPTGELRAAVLAVLAVGPCTLRDVAERSQVSYQATRTTLSNALRAAQVRICGHEKRAHAKRWCALYEIAPPANEDEAVMGGNALINAMQSFFQSAN